eukprot:CAMPEP_0181231436 /NCGR_PEP_ID=MMETSP1096-20121128/35101_1 /TAXON_ID=156174 ORGANISM="Chrysochromulina ericina, Strain CCMP281" /NCGR_SAMPLE_ID=MMETSP1096 /ASSEMBLY_ACC=CAM_ASM_000453 /LENGTH=71 /DNA_ID=CAMNT_0023325469 /DNA_START=88 /DNA_END=299 /DNA_ORIENTATION=+
MTCGLNSIEYKSESVANSRNTPPMSLGLRLTMLAMSPVLSSPSSWLDAIVETVKGELKQSSEHPPKQVGPS